MHQVISILSLSNLLHVNQWSYSRFLWQGNKNDLIVASNPAEMFRTDRTWTQAVFVLHTNSYRTVQSRIKGQKDVWTVPTADHTCTFDAFYGSMIVQDHQPHSSLMSSLYRDGPGKVGMNDVLWYWLVAPSPDGISSCGTLWWRYLL